MKLFEKQTKELPATLSGPLADQAFWVTRHGQQLDAQLTQRYGPALLVLSHHLEEEESGKKEKKQAKNSSGQRYICAGCSMAEDGAVRTDIVALASCPVLRAWMWFKLEIRIWLLAFHAQAYEPEASPGWGGVMALHSGMPGKLPDLRYSAAIKFALWVNEATNYEYKPFERDEEGAGKKLQAYGEANFRPALEFLSELDPDDRITVVPEVLRPGVVFWLGQPATRRLLGNQHWALFGGQWVVSSTLLTPEHALQCAKTLAAA